MSENTTEKIAAAKDQIRWEMKQRLAALSAAEYMAENSALRERFFTLVPVKKAFNFFIYYAVGREAATQAIILELLAQGKRVALPVCAPHQSMRACLIDSIDELAPARFGLMEPSLTALIAPVQLDLIVLPGLAFDESSRRLGRGAGYYDRFLPAALGAYKLGLAYDCQLLPELPHEPWDQRMDGVLTGTRFVERKSS